MRYLKLYENYKSYQSIDVDEYYRKTIFGNSTNEDPLEDSSYIKDNWESYTVEEIKEILAILPKGTKFTINAAMNPMYSKSKLDIMNVKVSKDNKMRVLVDFFIVKLRDEWYYLYVNHILLPAAYWKCDQLNGLINCMKQYV